MIIVGDPAVCAIESEITRAYERLSFRALGYFVIHVDGELYGVKAPDATLLACSFDQVEARLANRGRHTAEFSREPDPARVADVINSCVYGDDPDAARPDSGTERPLGLSEQEVSSVIADNAIIWAPDGDEAFDDGSSVLQFDVGEQVRIIAFRRGDDGTQISNVRDVWLPADNFYEILRKWHASFLSEWLGAPKEPA